MITRPTAAGLEDLMAESTNEPDPLFLQLVLSLQMGAWQQLGKIASPVSGKVERDLQMAKMTIDLLGMIQNKTTGNLNPEEKRMLDHALYELRLNYVDESAKEEARSEETPADRDKNGEEDSPSPGPTEPDKSE